MRAQHHVFVSAMRGRWHWHEGSPICIDKKETGSDPVERVTEQGGLCLAVIDQMLICTACRRCGTIKRIDLVSHRFRYRFCLCARNQVKRQVSPTFQGSRGQESTSLVV